MANRGAGQARRRALFGRAEGVRYGGGIEPNSGRRQRGRRRKRPSRLWRAAVRVGQGGQGCFIARGQRG